MSNSYGYLRASEAGKDLFEKVTRLTPDKIGSVDIPRVLKRLMNLFDEIPDQEVRFIYSPKKGCGELTVLKRPAWQEEGARRSATEISCSSFLFMTGEVRKREFVRRVLEISNLLISSNQWSLGNDPLVPKIDGIISHELKLAESRAGAIRMAAKGGFFKWENKRG